MEKELAEKLRDASTRLESFPSDVDQLLSLLDEIENLLVKVDQSPSGLIQDGYSKLPKALLSEPLLRHTDVDVQVSVASCISEITRITAPEAPYEDDRMKDVFQLIVSSFADLSNKSSRSYEKRASILETVAKIRSCVVMLDLECDGLISEMFQHFISSIRDDHPKDIFESMETIMTVVLEESEDVPVEILMPILASLRRENEEVPAIARKLGESVFSKCANKLKPFLKQAVKSSGLSLDDYSKIVTSICNGSNGEVELDDVNVAEEQDEQRKLTSTSSDGMTQVPREVPAKSINSNGVEGTADGEILNVDGERNATKRGMKLACINSDKEAAVICQKASDKETDESPVLVKDTHDTVDEVLHASPDKDEPPLPLPKILDDEVNVSSLSPNQSVPDESPTKKVGVSAKKDALAQELALVDSSPEKDGTSGMEIEMERHFEKKKVNLAQEDALSMDSAPEEEADVKPDAEIEPQKQSEKKENLVQEHESSKNLRDGDSDSEIKAQEPHRKNKGDSGEKDELSEDLISTKLSDGSCDSEKLSGKDKVKLSLEDVEPVSLKVEDGISVSEEKPQRRSGKKGVNTKKATSCVTKGKLLKGRGTSKTVTAKNDDEEEEPTQSAKEVDESDLGTKPLLQSGKEMTSGRRGQHLKKSDKVDGLETKLSNKKHETTNKEENRSDFEKDGDESGSETKALQQSGKEKTSRPVGQPLKKSVKGYVSEAKLSGKKEGKTNMDEDSPLKDRSKRALHVRDRKEKVLSVSHAKDDEQDIIRETVTKEKSSKRKRTPNEKASGDIEYGENLVGAKVKIWWPDDKQYYEGIIESFDIKKKKHKVSYTDGDEEVLVLQKEKWEFVDDATMQEEMEEDSSSDSSAKPKGEVAARNKAKHAVTRSGGKPGSQSKASNNSKGKSPGSGKAPETPKVKSADTSKSGSSGGKSGSKRKRGVGG